MAADALLAFKTSTKTKTGAGATTTFGAGATLADADAPLNILPQVHLREGGLFVKVLISCTGVTQATGTGTIQFSAALKASKTVNGTYTAIHQTPSDMVYLQTATAATNSYTGKTSFVAYIPLTAAAGFTDSTNTVQDLYTFFRVDITDVLGGGTAPTAGAYTYKVQIVSGKDGGIL